MGQLNGSMGNENTPNVIVNKYLNLDGLSKFWTKAKEYITNSQTTQTRELTGEFNTQDNAIRDFIGKLSVNGHKLAIYTAGVADTNGVMQPGSLALATDLTIDSADVPLTDGAKAALVAGTCVKVNPSAEAVAYDAATTVDSGLIQLDKRMDAVETAFQQGVVNNFTTTETHSEYKTDSEKAWISVSDHTKSTGEVSVDFDDTAITTKMKEIDQSIYTLEANAGVAGIRTFDDTTDTSTTGVGTGLVKFEMDVVAKKVNGVEQPTTVEDGDDTYYKGLLTLKVDETALTQKVSALDTADANEASSRKLDIAKLAGGSYVAGVDGAVGSWGDATPDYPTIKALSDNLKRVTDSVVASVGVTDTPNTGTDHNLVTLEAKYYGKYDATTGTYSEPVADGNLANVGHIQINLNHSALNQRIAAMDALDAEFAKFSVNGHNLFNVTSGDGVSPVAGAATAVTLYATDIKRGSGDSDADKATIAQTFTNLEGKIAALASATEFKGVVAWDPTAVTITAAGVDAAGVAQYKITGTNVPADTIMQNGDIVITGGTDSLSKEYILDVANNRFFELGDTTAEQTQLTEIQAWINSPITDAEINALFN